MKLIGILILSMTLFNQTVKANDFEESDVMELPTLKQSVQSMQKSATVDHIEKESRLVSLYIFKSDLISARWLNANLDDITSETLHPIFKSVEYVVAITPAAFAATQGIIKLAATRRNAAMYGRQIYARTTMTPETKFLSVPKGIFRYGVAATGQVLKQVPVLAAWTGLIWLSYKNFQVLLLSDSQMKSLLVNVSHQISSLQKEISSENAAELAENAQLQK